MNVSATLSLAKEAIESFDNDPSIDGFKEIQMINDLILSIESSNSKRETMTKEELDGFISLKPKIQAIIERYSKLKHFW